MTFAWPEQSVSAVQPTRLLFKPEEAAAIIGIGRSKLFQLVAAGDIETVTIGRARRIPGDALEAYVHPATQ